DAGGHVPAGAAGLAGSGRQRRGDQPDLGSEQRTGSGRLSRPPGGGRRRARAAHEGAHPRDHVSRHHGEAGRPVRLRGRGGGQGDAAEPVGALQPGRRGCTLSRAGRGYDRPQDTTETRSAMKGAARQRRAGSRAMKLFVDSGNIKEIEALAALGVLDGATTNPSLLAKVGGDPRQILKEICRIVQGPVSGEVVSTNADEMVLEGRDLAAIDEHVVVKVPFTREGVKACRILSGEGIRVNVT